MYSFGKVSLHAFFVAHVLPGALTPPNPNGRRTSSHLWMLKKRGLALVCDFLGVPRGQELREARESMRQLQQINQGVDDGGSSGGGGGGGGGLGGGAGGRRARALPRPVGTVRRPHNTTVSNAQRYDALFPCLLASLPEEGGGRHAWRSGSYSDGDGDGDHCDLCGLMSMAGGYYGHPC